MCHKKRTKDSCSNITPSLDCKLSVSKIKFLSNVGNKQLFLCLLQNYLTARGIKVTTATSDADVLMCREAVEYCYGSDVSLIGDGTDLLVLLLHMMRHHSFEHKLILTIKTHVYDLEKTRIRLGEKIGNSILLIHAFTGCDTTSRIRGICKDKLFKVIGNVSSEIIDAFYSPTSPAAQIKDAGEQLFILLLSRITLSLDDARLLALQQRVLTSSIEVKCQQLPPTSGSAAQHSYRVYHQIQQWDEMNLDPTLWGWKIKKGQYLPYLLL